jgi:hypothetical protein
MRFRDLILGLLLRRRHRQPSERKPTGGWRSMDSAPRDQKLIGGRYDQWRPEWLEFETWWNGEHWHGDPDMWKPKKNRRGT